MKWTRIIRKILVASATIGLLVPQISVNAQDQVTRTQAELLSDVALDANGTLNGQILTVNGIPVAGTKVAIQQQGQEVATATTDAQGSFRVDGLRGGVYMVSTPEGTVIYRVWSNRLAPPSASKGILLIRDGKVIRGCYIFNEYPTFMGICFLGVAGGIVAIAASHSSGS